MKPFDLPVAKAVRALALCSSVAIPLVAQEPKPHWGYIDREGEWAIPAAFDDAWPFSEGLGLVKLDGKFYFLDRTGQVRIAVRTDAFHVEPFSHGRALVRISQGAGYIGTDGNWAIQKMFDRATSFSEGLAVADDRYIDINGEEVEIPGDRDGAGPFSDGLAAFKPTGSEKWGYMDLTGAVIIKPQFYEAKPFVHGWARVKKSKSRKDEGIWIDRKGKEVPKPQINGGSWNDDEAPGADGLVPDAQSYRDTLGREVIPSNDKWYATRSFREDLAPVKKEDGRGYWGYIGRDGAFAFTATFDEGKDFSEGLAPVMTGMAEVRAAGRKAARRGGYELAAASKAATMAALVKSVPPKAYTPDGRVRWVWYDARMAMKAYADRVRTYYVDYAVIVAPLDADPGRVLAAAPRNEARRHTLSVAYAGGVFVDTTGSPGSDLAARMGLVNPNEKLFKSLFMIDSKRLSDAEIRKP